MYLKTLGGLELTESKLTRPKPLLLLTYLVLEGAKERRHLSELFYRGTRDPMTSLRVALKHIRKDAENALVTQNATAKATVPADALELLNAVERQNHLKTLHLYRGAFLDGFYLKNWGVELEEWVLGTREYLAGQVRRALLELGETAVAQGDVRAAARYAEQAYLLPTAPPPEPEQVDLMYGLLLAGKSARAAELRREFADLGMPLRLEKLCEERPSQLPPDTPNNLSTSATSFVGRQGELADLTRHLSTTRYRLLTLLGTGGVGKTRLGLELARAQLAHARWDGVYFVGLAAVRDAALVPVHIAQALSYRLQGGDNPLEALSEHIGQRRLLLVLDNYEQLTGDGGTIAELWRRCPNLSLIVTSRERLNLAAEQVYTVEGLPVAPDPTRGATPLEEGHEAAVELFVQRAKSAQLRFRLTPKSVVDVLKICRLVEGAPLGIELAAAWVRVMPLADIVQALSTNLDALVSRQKDTPERHKSLRAAFEHSWQLLTPQEQDIFKKLSVFRGGFRREAAANVTGASIPVLAALIDKSLIRVSNSGRYYRHALLHQFAAEKLAANPDEQRSYETRHTHYFLKLAEAAEPQLRRAAQARWLTGLEEETHNFQAALTWSLRHHRTDVSLRLASALGLFWYLRSSFEEGQYWLDKVLAQPRLPRTSFYAKTLHSAGRLARSYGDFRQAQTWLEEGLALCHSLDDASGAVKCLNELGASAAAQADYAAAIDLFEQGRAIARRVGDEENLNLILGNLGLAQSILGNFEQAKTLLEQSLAATQKWGDEHGAAHTLSNLALIASRQHDFGQALELYTESFDIGRSLHDKLIMAEALLGKAVASKAVGDGSKARVFVEKSLELYLDQKDPLGVIDGLSETASLASAAGAAALAVRLWGATEVLRQRLNFPMRPFERGRYEDDRRRARAQLPGFDTAWAEGELWSLDEAAARARAWLTDPTS